MTSTLPPLEGLLAGLHVVALPLAVPFRGVSVREIALLEGPSGWGEFAPFLEYSPESSAPWLASAIEAAWGVWPQEQRAEVPINATVPAVEPERVPEVLARFGSYRAVKVKVAQAGQQLRDDLSRVAAVRAAVGAAVPIRVDANGAWQVDEALAAIGALNRYHLEYVEQPCASIDELSQLRLGLARAGVDVPIAADESVRLATDPLEVAQRGAADLLVIKAAPLGGVTRALEIVAESGMPAVVSSALDSSVGMATGVQLAACLPELPFACGLATTQLLTADITETPQRAVEGQVRPGRAMVHPELLLQQAVSHERLAWWRERLEATYQHLV